MATRSCSVSSRSLHPKMRKENNRRCKGWQRGCWGFTIHQARETSTAFNYFCWDRTSLCVLWVSVLHCAAWNSSSFPAPDCHVQGQVPNKILDPWSSVRRRLWLPMGVCPNMKSKAFPVALTCFSEARLLPKTEGSRRDDFQGVFLLLCFGVLWIEGRVLRNEGGWGQPTRLSFWRIPPESTANNGNVVEMGREVLFPLSSWNLGC